VLATATIRPHEKAALGAATGDEVTATRDDGTWQHLHATPQPLAAIVPGVDPELEKLVLCCLAKDPADRPASARALRVALARCPSSADWTSDMASAWWTMHDRLLHPRDPATMFATVEQPRVGQK
jgi:hypothetical protein